jgi:hypothetical protein
MTVLISQVITAAFQQVGIVDESIAPSALQMQNGLNILNNYLANQQADGMRLGWYPQTNVSATAPLRDQDIWGVQWLLSGQLLLNYGVTLDPQDGVDAARIAAIAEAERMLTKRSIKYFESDLSELSRPEGGPWGGPGWI